MENTIYHLQCPVCESKNIGRVLTAQDHTVSHREFEVWECADCHFRFTQNIPGEESIGAYYKSDDYVSHSNTRKGFVNQLYHLVRKRTLSQKLALVKKYSDKSTGNLLDIGAGTGAFAATMQHAGWQVTGLEPDPDARDNAQKDYRVHLDNLSNLFSLEKNSYDVITLWHVLEHVHLLHGYIETFHGLLKESGTLVIAVPNYTSFDAEYYGKDWAAWDVPRHLWHFSPESMDRLLTQHGFSVITHLPMKFDSFYVSMLSESVGHSKGNLWKAFITGLKSNRKAGANAQKYSSVIYIMKKA